MGSLEPISPFSNTIRIGRVVAPPQTIENVRVDAGFDGTSLIVNRVSADLLGGSFWARSTLLPLPDALDFTANVEVLDLDMAQLSREPLSGDSHVSADAQTSLKVRTDGKLSAEGLLDELEARFHLTRLGAQALDRLISYLDPKGEDPSMVQVRGLLREPRVAAAVKNPQVSLQVSHGILDADIALPGVKFIDVAIPIRGISVKNLLNMAGVRKSLEGLVPALNAARYLLLAGIDDNGKVVFFQEAPK
jgi:hypothetical protein